MPPVLAAGQFGGRVDLMNGENSLSPPLQEIRWDAAAPANLVACKCTLE
jgi:hypothetical protein